MSEPKYNKAQEECIQGWGDAIVRYPCDDGSEQAGALKDFLNEFHAIDPEPDPELYSIRLTDPGQVPPCLFTHEKVSKEVAEARILTLLSQYHYNVQEFRFGEHLLLKDGRQYQIIPQWKLELS